MFLFIISKPSQLTEYIKTILNHDLQGTLSLVIFMVVHGNTLAYGGVL